MELVCGDTPEALESDAFLDDIAAHIVEYCGGTQYTIDTRTSGAPLLTWTTQSELSTMTMSAGLLQFIANEYPNQRLQMCTEYNCDCYCFCAHPNYQKSGPFFDWMMVSFETSPGHFKNFPSQLCSVIMCPGKENDDQPSHQLIINCTTRRTKRDSTIGTEWEFDPDTFHVVDGAGIVGPVFVVLLSDNLVVSIQSRSEWADNFCEY